MYQAGFRVRLSVHTAPAVLSVLVDGVGWECSAPLGTLSWGLQQFAVAEAALCGEHVAPSPGFSGGSRRALLAAAAASAVLADINTYDCKMKQLGLDFVQTLQPFRPLSNFQVQPGAVSLCPVSGV